MTTTDQARNRPTLILNLAGVTGAQLADELGLTRQAVSLHLRGQTAATPGELLEAIHRIAGPNVADEVARAITVAREAGSRGGAQ